MRRHAKRSTKATISVIAALCVALMLSASASAKPTYTETTFGCSAATKCDGAQEWAPSKLAVNSATGDVYVLDSKPEEGAIRVFDKDGTYKSTISGTSMEGGKFGFSGLDDIAIDNSGGANQGRIYLSTGFGGKFLGFDADVSSAAAVVSDAWVAEGEDLIGGLPLGIAVDTTGKVYGSEYNMGEGGGVQERDPATGALLGSPIVTDAQIHDPASMAFNSEDDLYLNRFDTGGLVRLLASTGYATPGTAFDGINHSDVEVDRSRDRAYTVASNLVLRYFEPDDSEPEAPLDSGVSGRSYQGLTVNSTTQRLYISDSGNAVVEIWDQLSKLTVKEHGLATGEGDITCDAGSGPEACKADYPEGSEVTIVATPKAGSKLTSVSGIGGASSCKASGCKFTLNSDGEVIVRFDLIVKHKLTVKTAGTGSGTVTCNGASCAAEYEAGTDVTLEAKAAAGSTFSGWSGENCSGTGTCKVKMSAARTVTATFTANPTGGGGGGGGGDTGGGGGGGGGGTIIVDPPPVDKLGPCIAAANKAAQKAKKAAKKKKGKAKAKAIKAANKRKARAIKACKAKFA